MRDTSGDSAPARPPSVEPEAAVPFPRLVEDYAEIARIYGDTRAPERIIAHYQLERRLAAILRNASKRERESGVYTHLYDALLGELDDHPRKRPVTKRGQDQRDRYVGRQVRMVLDRVGRDHVFLEIGGGDCEVSLRVSPHVKQTIVVDVTDELVPPDVAAANFRFIKVAGVTLPLPDESVDFIYSNQVMEHLHPDDAVEQVRELFRVLKPGGRYLCRTPSRLTGPHDVSCYFDTVAVGTHIKEYTYRELATIFAEAEFTNICALIAPRAFDFFVMPRFLAFALEDMFARVPRRWHTRVCRSRAVRALLGVSMVVQKPR
ncbi:MAG: methyltransferase domain-containing protein [Hyphomonadaceae bacterium]